MVLLDRGVIDRNARIVDGFVHYAGRVGLRSPSEIIHGFRPVAFAGGVDLVDRDHFARLRLSEQVLIVKAPPCGRVAAESLSGILRIGARPGCDVDNAQLDHVTLLGAAYVDRAGADVHAEALAAATPPAAAKLDLKNDRRSRSSVSLNLRWCNSNSGQFLSSPAHIVSLLVSTWVLGARLIPSQIIVTVKLVRYVIVDCWTAKCSIAA